ncbi:MAG TPA: shikimate dehydrogenase [Bacteroidales bacterium]|nr:shikimate dehydrogenase [Bacteroidales bacterium]
MRKYGLIGFPLGHSFSKKYFTEKFQSENIVDCSYENFPIKDIDQLPDLIENEPELVGFNVTVPHKSDVIKYLSYISPEAKEIGAVNVVKVHRNENSYSLSGFNSDVYGFTMSILPWLKSRSGNALILGTGGSSKAVSFALRKIGMNVTLVSRRNSPDGITYNDINSDITEKTDIIVNTTPLGMYPDIEGKPPINYDLLNSTHIIYDLVYNPELTAFLREGQERGCVVVNGLRMLHLQAEKAWEIWNDENLP